jgi:hypothetical protein
MRLKGLDILISSNEPWGDTWYSKHNYANELSRHNRVVFVDPVGKWHPKALAGARVSLTPVSDRLSVLRYVNVLPAINDLSFRLNNTIVSRAIRKCLHMNGFNTDLFLPFDPTRLYDPALLGAARSIFIAVDRYTMHFRGERFLYRRVDGVITLSEGFNPTYAPFAKPILTIGHGISADEFDAEPLEGGVRGHGLYVGTIDHRLDLVLLRRMVEENPSVPFVFIGRYALVDSPAGDQLFRQGRYPNIQLLGAVPFKQLARHIAGARFCLAPMDVRVPGNAISHHKVFQYLALGKPTFSTVFSEYASIAQLLYMENDIDLQLAKLHAFLDHGEDPGLAAARIAFARTKSYEAIFQRIEDFLKHMDNSHSAPI